MQEQAPVRVSMREQTCVLSQSCTASVLSETERTCASVLCESVREIWSVIGVSCVSLGLGIEILTYVSPWRTSETSSVSSLSHARDHESETYTHTNQKRPCLDKEKSVCVNKITEKLVFY